MAAKAPFKFWSFFFSTRGRVSRMPFAVFVLPVALGIQAMAWVVLPALREAGFDFTTVFAIVAINGAVRLLTLWPQMALYWKRLHDVGWTGWLSLPLVSPVLSASIVFLVLKMTTYDLEYGRQMMTYVRWFEWIATAYSIALALLLTFLAGRNGANRYGPDPRRPENASDLF